MSIPNINYRETHFPKPDLTPIIGKPTFEDLYQLLIDLRLNAQSVHSNLGGGNHGHLGLIMTPQQYAIQSQIPYVRPNYPGPLTVPPGSTRLVADELERNHNENLRVFHETRGVEQALIQQIVSAIDNQYLLAFKNRTTGQFNGDVMQILQYLLATYGRISPAQLTAFDEEVTKMTYDPTTPIDLVFAKIDDLLMYGEFAQCPFSTEQAITKAYHILNNCGTLYNEYLRAWNRRNTAHRTWPAFQEHFREAFNELEATGSLTMDQMGFGSANFIEQVATRVSNDIMNHANLNTSSAPTEDTISPVATSSQPTANAVTDNNLLAELLAQNKQLIESLANQGNRSLANQGTHSSRQSRRPTGPRQGQPRTPLAAHFDKYCWTHGRCNHNGSACRNKAPGHKDEATMDNKMEGSTYACP